MSMCFVELDDNNKSALHIHVILSIEHNFTYNELYLNRIIVFYRAINNNNNFLKFPNKYNK